MDNYHFWVLIGVLLVVPFLVVGFVPPARFIHKPLPPPPPRPSSGMAAQELLKIMRADLEDFKAGRPSMLQKHMPTDANKGEFGVQAEMYVDHVEAQRKGDTAFMEFFTKPEEPVDWDKELKGLK